MRWRRIAIWAGCGVLALLVMLTAGYLWLDSRAGRAFVADRLASYAFENGLNLRIGRIDGSLYDHAVLHDVRLRDARGEFARLPQVQLDWHPFDYLNGVIAIDALTTRELRLARLPALSPVPDRGEPFLPDLDIRLGRVTIDRIEIAPEIAGRTQIASITGTARIADRRAVVTAAARSQAGDRLDIKVDAVPDDNRLDLGLALAAPVGGLVTGLIGSAEPVAAQLAGKGTWQSWDGALNAKAGTTPIAAVKIAARSGRFAARGLINPQQVLGPGALGDAFSARTAIDLSVALERRVATISGRLASDALGLAANGVADLAAGQYRNLALALDLRRPGALAANISGDGLRGALVLNGDFAAPSAEYSLTARRLAFGTTVIEGLTASGQARAARQGMIIPVKARAQRITGVNPAIGGLLTNATLSGQFAYADSRILSDDLVIRSDRADATAIVVGDLAAGRYTGALRGRVNGYRVESLGTFDLVTAVDLATGRTGYQLVGTVRARSTRLFSPGVQNFLGGQMLVNAAVRFGTDGILRVTRATLIAPDFRVNRGQGSYALDSGRLAFDGSGFSDRYGPVSLNLSGTIDRPVARVVAARPGLGIGLADVNALVTRSAQGYAITLNGSTDYGPLSGAFDVLAGSGPLTIDVRQGNFAGVALGGRLRQTAAGPFEGTLRGLGSGFSGLVTLSAAGRYQRAQIQGTATNAVLQGAQRLAVGRGIVTADLVLFDQPQVQADIQIEDAVIGETSLARGRARIAYRGGSGTAQLLAEGRNRLPFRIAANAALSPSLWRVAITGKAGGTDIASAGPLRIVPAKGSYSLLPATLRVGNGSVQMTGRYGPGLTLQSRLANVNLSILNAFAPGWGIGGVASGSLDWSQASAAAFPQADARLQVARFTRAELGAVSQPVDIALVGRLLPDGGNARAVVRRRGAPVGRLQVDLRPLPPGSANWTTRLLAAPLSGGIRYNGPAETLFSLAALADQNLSGAIGVAADFSGQVRQPRLTGVVRANDLTYENAVYGTRLTRMRVRGEFTNDQLQVTELTARAGDGTISGRGFVNLSSDRGFPAQLALNLDQARVARSELVSAAASGTIAVVNTPGDGALISGTLRLPETRYKIVRQGAAQVTTLTGIRRKAIPGRLPVQAIAMSPVATAAGNWRLDLRLVSEGPLYVTGMGLNSEWRANLRVTGVAAAPQVAGEMELLRGTLDFAGRSFEIENGRLSFTGGAATNPVLRVAAASEVDGVTVRVNITGTGANPQIGFTSTPALPQDEIMARILFGDSIAELSAIQAVQLAASLNSLRGGSGGLNPLGVLQSATGIDRLRILGADSRTGRGTAVALGQYITNDIYTEIVTDARGYTATQIEVNLTPALSVLSRITSQGSSNVGLRYRKDY